MRKQLFFLFTIIMLVVSGSSFLSGKTNNNKVDEWYVQQLELLQQKLKTLQESIRKKSSLPVLKQQFSEARMAYKKAAILIEYFNVYEAKYLNGPALKKVEEDNPTVILAPQGFQVMEEKLWGEKKELNDALLYDDIVAMLLTVQKLLNEPDRIYKFRDEAVFDALRAATLRMMTMGITGFDSPIAQASMTEAVATLRGMIDIIQLYRTSLRKQDESFYRTLLSELLAAEDYILANGSDFDTFNRLVFIKQHANPLYKSIVQIRMKMGFTMPDERRPVNVNATSIFDSNAFDIRFFSPAERYQLTPERIELGRKLFYDPLLSGTGSRSCASCHQPQKAFTDGLPVPMSIDNKRKLARNTPILWNAALQTRQFYDSRTTTLEDQLSAVVHDPNEMQGSLEDNIPLLKKHPQYAQFFKQAYPDHKDPIIQYNIANAIASYIRTLVALNSRFDLYMRGDDSKLTRSEQKGFNLFMGKAKCGTCHYMPLFNGLVPTEFVETESEVLGVPSTNSKKKPSLDADKGKYNFTTAMVHQFAFKTPTLRNISLTAPYMHNGVFKTLEDVMDFYNKGGGSGLNIAPETQTLPPEKLGLSKQEIKDIIGFMRALADTTVR
jgi:cytochrome c peroxidase